MPRRVKDFEQPPAKVNRVTVLEVACRCSGRDGRCGWVEVGWQSIAESTAMATGDGPVNAEADFTASAGSLSLTLHNFQQNPTADGQ